MVEVEISKEELQGEVKRLPRKQGKESKATAPAASSCALRAAAGHVEKSCRPALRASRRLQTDSERETRHI